jgi:hypothetical protein
MDAGRQRMDIALSSPANGPLWQSVKVDGALSDTANLCWSKDNVMALGGRMGMLQTTPENAQ